MEKLVFDASGTTLKSALMTADGSILDERRQPVPDGQSGSFDEFLALIADAYGRHAGQVDGIAVSLPGRIDTARGVVLTPGALAYNNGVHLTDEIRTRVADLPCVIVNDGKAAAAGEYWKGNLAGTSCGVVILLGTGIGGGIVMGGRVWEGAHAFAGEFSHAVERPGMVRSDEHRWVDSASIPGLIRFVSQRTGMPERLLDGKKVFQMIESGNDFALAGLRDMTNYLAYMVFDLICILDPERVLLGGSIAREPLLLQLVQEELDRLVGLVPEDLPRLKVGVCKHAGEGSLIGALYELVTRHPEIA